MHDHSVSLNAGILANSLSRILASITKRETLPILSHVLIEVRDTVVVLTGNNLESQMSIDIPVVAGVTFSITTSAQKLAEIAGHLDQGREVVLTVSGSTLLVNQSRSRFKLNTLPADEFPKIEADRVEGDFTMPERDLLSLLNEVGPAMSANDVRHYLNGALMVVNGGEVRAVATDGHRLNLSQTKSGQGFRGTRSVIIPRSALGIVSRMLTTGTDEVSVGISRSHIHIGKPGWRFVGKLIDGQYPAYEKVIPTPELSPATLNRLAFRDLITRSLVLAPEKTHGINLTFEVNHLSVDVKDGEGEECQDSMVMQYGGPVVTVGINGHYLLDALNTLGGDDVRVSFKDSNSSMLLKGLSEETLCLVMPMRL